MNQSVFNSLIKKIQGDIWLEGLFGIEKENIRVDTNGNLAQTPHPRVFGNKRKNPFITTDFSESQIEMITPPLSGLKQALAFLGTLQDLISLELDGELLWPQSMPPILPDDKQIPIAQYDDMGKEAQQYRELLAAKYGPKSQLFSGIHFNLSFSENLLRRLYNESQTKLSFEDFKDEIYLKTTRQLLRLRWLFVLLFGNSPVVDSSMELKCKKSPFITRKHVVGLSIRNSCFGYQNIDDLHPEYNSVIAYNDSIARMIKEGKLASPKELYTTVRPKFLNNNNHISYLEVRFIDINPLVKEGITEEALYFIHSLALYGLLTDEQDNFDVMAQKQANNYHDYIAIYGLDPKLRLHEAGSNQTIWTAAKKQVEGMFHLFKQIGIKHEGYMRGLKYASDLIENPENRSVFEVLDGIMSKGYINYHMHRARLYLAESQKKSFTFHGLEDMELSTQLLLREAVKRGVEFEILDRKENFVRLSRNGNTQYVKQATKTSLDNYASILAMENKLVTKHILRKAGLIVPGGFEYTNRTDAKNDFWLFEGKPIVIKPNQTNFGIGITILKDNLDENIFCKAIDIAFDNDATILIEEFIDGREYRFFIIENEVAGILHRVPANVVGDGIHTIRELVNIKNENPLRGKGYHTPLEKIQMGEAEAIFLNSQQKNFEYIPTLEEVVYLRENSNISTGGDSIDVTDDIPDYYKEIAVKAASALNVSITGLDMIIKDINNKTTTDNYAIIELNFNPAIHIHCHPLVGKNRKLDMKLMDALGYTME